MSGTRLQTEQIQTSKRQIKVPKVNGDKFPLEESGQKFQVIRLVLPKDAKEVGMEKRWGNQKVGIQLLGCFETYEEAEKMVKIYVEKEDWSDYYIVEMYQWLELPPPELSPDKTTRIKQPLLDDYMKAAQTNKVKEAQLMELRVQMSKDKDNKEAACDIMLPEHELETLETQLEQLKEIMEPDSDYPEAMKKEAGVRMKKVCADLKKLKLKMRSKEMKDDLK